MYDILDPLVLPRKLGTISTAPALVAREASRALKAFGVPTTVFLDRNGDVYAQPAVYAHDHPVDEIVGIYSSGIDTSDIAEDLGITLGARLAAIGMLENWGEAPRAA
ncbi:MAG: hypothetical protein EOP90_13815 [Lysobacteraceae bacterium]|nr:MAG: hypothetical protein EOP90_13815 [Xanthomonadaceae bacterium]